MYYQAGLLSIYRVSKVTRPRKLAYVCVWLYISVYVADYLSQFNGVWPVLLFSCSTTSAQLQSRYAFRCWGLVNCARRGNVPHTKFHIFSPLIPQNVFWAFFVTAKLLHNCEDHFHLYSLSAVHSYDLSHINITPNSPNSLAGYNCSWRTIKEALSVLMLCAPGFTSAAIFVS